MKQVYIHPTNKSQIDGLVKNLPQSLLISGPANFGLLDVVEYICKLVLIKPEIINPEKDEKIDFEKGIISVEMIRDIYKKSAQKTKKKQIIVINFADKMTVQAQNAFLKLLEEPNSNMNFILVVSDISKIILTIISRVVQLNIKPITTKQSEELLSELNVSDAKKRVQLLYVADGLPFELKRLISDNEYFDKRSGTVREAREFINATLYKKLIIANKFKDSRQDAIIFLDTLLNILDKTIVNNSEINLLKTIETVLSTRNRLELNENIRLSLAFLALQMV